ncbi:helix-turn-helix domain-containing protein [Nocardia sp. NPDC052278]|uniref:helix-turn-helix domain-containing protein n=1 Tax=unclassified Nocardia TaxID=2637762 RepID=UPI00369DB53B
MTTAATWSTSGISRHDALDAWNSKLSELHLGWAMSFPEPERFGAAMRYRRVDSLTVAEFRTDCCAGRLPASVRDGEPFIGILMNLSGRIVCKYASGGDFVVDAGQLTVWDSEIAKAFEVVDPHRELYLLVPRRRAPQGLIRAALSAGGAVAAGPGSGLVSIAADQFRGIARELGQLSDAGLAIACQALFDTLDSALTEPVPSSRASLLLQVRRYIEDNLDDPDLSPTSIASVHGISVRTLQLAFAETGMTVSRWIRDRRLNVCYRNLAQARPTETVTDVAFRWGFNNVGHFSRTFKQAFGVSPSRVLAESRSGSDDSAALRTAGP